MIKKPIFSFDNLTSTGLDKVPLNSIISIESTKQMLLLTDKTSVTSVTTISTLLGLVGQYTSLDSAEKYTTKTTTYTAVANDYIYASTASGSFTITLPASPVAQDKVTIVDNTGNFEVNNLTVARNGKTIMGLAEDILLDVSNKEYRFLYNGTTWRVFQ